MPAKITAAAPQQKKKHGFLFEIKKNLVLYLMTVPGILFFLVFSYIPMGGLVMAFQNFKPLLGFTKSQIFFKVTLLQMIKRIVPPMSNEIITLVKDTSLARIIAVYELIWSGQTFIKSAGIIWPLFYTTVFYLVFNGGLTLLFGYIERKLDFFKC